MAVILSFATCPVPVLLLARPEVQGWPTRSFIQTLLGGDGRKSKEAVAHFHSLPECSRRRKLGAGEHPLVSHQWRKRGDHCSRGSTKHQNALDSMSHEGTEAALDPSKVTAPGR